MENKNVVQETISALQNGQVTQRQYEALEVFISHSLVATIRAKKVILWLLRQTNYLQKNVVMTVPFTEQNSDDAKFSKEVADAVHNMNSSNTYPKHAINAHIFFAAMGFSKELSFHSGIAKKNGTEKSITFETGWDSDKQDFVPLDYYGYTIWLSEKSYQTENVELILFNPADALQSKLRVYYSDSNFPEFYDDKKLPKEFFTLKLVEK